MRWAAALLKAALCRLAPERIHRRTNFQRGFLYIGARRALMGGKWTPLDYFRRGEQGAWYDPSDLSTLFQDAAGTTPVTGIEQPVGLMLDKRLGLVLGPERVTGDNSTFTTGTGDWASRINASISAVGGELVCTATATNGTAGLFLTGLTVGVSYVISCTARTGTSSAAQIRLGTGNAIYTLSNTSTALTGVFSAVDATCDLQVIAGTAGTFYIDNISVRELPGNHAFQTTATSRPVLRQDANGKYYLYTDGIDDFMVTNAINFTGTDKMTVIAGVRNLSDAASIVAEFSNNAAVNDGSFYFVSGTDYGGIGYSSIARGTMPSVGVQIAFATPFVAPDTAVISMTHDIAGDLSTIRRNGVAGTNGTGDKGTGNYGNYPLYLFRRGGTLFPANVNFYGLIIRGAETQDAQLNPGQRFIANKTGVVL